MTGLQQPSCQWLASTSLQLCPSFHTLMHWCRAANELHVVTQASSALIFSHGHSLVQVLFYFIHLSWTRTHPRFSCHLTLLSDSDVLSVISSNQHICFISVDDMLSPGGWVGHVLTLPGQCCQALPFLCLCQGARCHPPN